MLRLNTPFHLTLDLSHAFFRGRGLTRSFSRIEVTLSGLSVSLETEGKTYHVVSEQQPELDRPGNSGGMIWPFYHWTLGSGVAIEQQMMLPVGGDAIAISWRLSSRSASPVRLTVTPVFEATEPLQPAGFEFEPETAGGRLIWHPFCRSSSIIADTNGHFLEPVGPIAADFVPGSFEFDLGPNPAVLILRATPAWEARVNPLIGGFLAQLSDERTCWNDSHANYLVAA